MQFTKQSKEWLSELGLLFTVAVWGTTFVIVKDTLRNIDPLILVGYRFFISAAVLGIILLFFKQKLFTNIKQGIILGFILWLLYVPQTIGLKYTTASNSVFITGLFIVFVPVFSFILFKKFPTIIQISSIIIAVIGFWFLTGGINNINRGDAITLITAIGGALHILVADHYIKKNNNPFILNFQQLLVVSVLSFAIGGLLQRSFIPTNYGVIWPILFLAIIPGLAAYTIQLVAQKYTAPIKVALIFVLEPVFGALFAWTLGGEHVVPVKAFGGVLIVVAMMLPELLKLFKINK